MDWWGAGGRKAEDGGQETEDGRQGTEDGGQKSEIRGRRSEVRVVGSAVPTLRPLAVDRTARKRRRTTEGAKYAEN